MDIIQHLQHVIELPLPSVDAHKELVPHRYRSAMAHIHPNKDTRQSGVLILLYHDNDSLYFPLIVRARHEGSAHSGQVAFPGGKYEEADTDIQYTAFREAHEEIGLQLDEEVLTIGQLSPTFVQVSNFMIYPTVAYLPHVPDLIADPSEVDQILPVALDELLDAQNLKETTVSPRPNQKIKTPYFALNDRIVWGATAMILNELRWLILRK